MERGKRMEKMRQREEKDGDREFILYFSIKMKD